MNKKVAVIGAGSWGTALAILLANNGHQVGVWSCFIDEIDMLKEKREHLHKLPGIKVPEGVKFSNSLKEVAEFADIFVLVVPSQTIRESSKKIVEFARDKIVVCCSKGIEDSTSKRLSEVIEEELPFSKVVVLSGPSHAEEVAQAIPTAVTAASSNQEAAKRIQDVFMSENFRVYTNTDVVGVELGGALKNVIALCAGISDGLKFGDNTKAALMTRGLSEITRLGNALGADVATFSGLAGIGDLIVTCTSMHSRNRRAGILIGQGKSLDEALNEVKMVVEGVTTTKAAYRLARMVDVEMPITNEAYKILFEGKNARQAVLDLMTRDKKGEVII
jgi:glycerol-3-phosphate dehydrogenase (NAD(P)+)